MFSSILRSFDGQHPYVVGHDFQEGLLPGFGAGVSRIHDVFGWSLQLFGAPVEREFTIVAAPAHEPESPFLAALVLPCIVVVIRHLVGVVAREGCGADQDSSKEPVEAVVAISRVIDQGHGVVCVVEFALHAYPVLIGLFFTVYAPFEHFTGDFGKDAGVGKCGRNFELEDLFVLAPVDDEAKLDEIHAGELGDVENDLGVLPAGSVAGDAGDRAVFDNGGGDKGGTAHLLAELIDAVRPGVAGVADGDQSDGGRAVRRRPRP